MERKTYTAKLDLLEGEQPGRFRAEFATLDVIDLDRDVTVPGAFQDGQQTLIEAWNHNYGQLPVGKGVIREADGKAVIEGMFFLDTQSGQEHYKVVKALGDLQQWSYTFDIQDQAEGEFDGQPVRFLRKLDVWGVAPVQRGAGIGTRTVAIKGAEGALEGRSTTTTDVDVEPAELKAVRDARNSVDDTPGGPEGQTGDGEPSGTAPGVLQTLIEIELLEG